MSAVEEPSPNKVLPEGLSIVRCERCDGEGGWQVGYPVCEWSECPECHEIGLVLSADLDFVLTRAARDLYAPKESGQ